MSKSIEITQCNDLNSIASSLGILEPKIIYSADEVLNIEPCSLLILIATESNARSIIELEYLS